MRGGHATRPAHSIARRNHPDTAPWHLSLCAGPSGYERGDIGSHGCHAEPSSGGLMDDTKTTILRNPPSVGAVLDPSAAMALAERLGYAATGYTRA